MDKWIMDNWIQGSDESAIERARQAMRHRGLDAVLVASPGLVAFLTGHVMPAHLGFPSRDGRQEKPTLALITGDSAMTIGSAPRPVVGEALTFGEGAQGLFDGPQAYAALANAARQLGLSSGTVGVESALVPAAAVAAFTEAVPRADLVPLDDAFRMARAVKSPAELAELADAIALCDVGQDTVRRAVRPGASEAGIYSAAIGAMVNAAGDYIVPLGEIQVGVRGQLMMGGPSAATIADGELAMCDLAPRHPNGWWGDSCLTVACGEPSADARRDWQILRDAMEVGRERLRPGVTAAEVYDAVAGVAGEQPGHAGHGIGRDHYEEPRIAPGQTQPLAAGSVVVLEPGRYGGGRGIRIEHAFRVTSDGGEPMSMFDLEMTA